MRRRDGARDTGRMAGGMGYGHMEGWVATRVPEGMEKAERE